MTKRAKDVTRAELAVLRLLWERESATIRELTEALYPEGKAAQYATVQKLLERLERKGCAGRERGPGAHVFRATVARGDLIDRRLEALADGLCEGSLVPLLTQLVSRRALSAADRGALRALVEELDLEQRRRSR